MFQLVTLLVKTCEADFKIVFNVKLVENKFHVVNTLTGQKNLNKKSLKINILKQGIDKVL